jgi:hypothetical protein
MPEHTRIWVFAFDQHGQFSELDRDITLEFIRAYPAPDHAKRVGAARMESFCPRQQYTGRVDPQVLVDRLKPHLLSASAGMPDRGSARSDLGYIPPEPQRQKSLRTRHAGEPVPESAGSPVR